MEHINKSLSSSNLNHLKVEEENQQGSYNPTVNSNNSSTVNSKSSTNTSTNTVNSKPVYSTPHTDKMSTIEEQLLQVLKNAQTTDEGVAQLLADGLDDKKSIWYYHLLAKEHNHARLLNFMHQTIEAAKENRIKTTKPIYFQAILRRQNMKTKFKPYDKVTK